MLIPRFKLSRHANSYSQGIQDTKCFDECAMRMRQREQELIRVAKLDANEKSRRDFSNHSSTFNSHTDSSPLQKTPQIPWFILNKVKPNSAIKGVLKWREIFNAEGRIIRKDRIQKIVVGTRTVLLKIQEGK